jgi:UDP-glucose 4-epimerase
VSRTFSSDGDQFDAFAGDEIQRFVDIGDLVEAHFASVGFRQGFARNHLQQQHQLQAIAEVVLNVLNAGASFAQVRITPRREGLDNNFIIKFNHFHSFSNEIVKK